MPSVVGLGSKTLLFLCMSTRQGWIPIPSTVFLYYNVKFHSISSNCTNIIGFCLSSGRCTLIVLWIIWAGFFWWYVFELIWNWSSYVLGLVWLVLFMLSGLETSPGVQALQFPALFFDFTWILSLDWFNLWVDINNLALRSQQTPVKKMIKTSCLRMIGSNIQNQKFKLQGQKIFFDIRK